MDGSFLSQQDVVTASRSFVCIRLMTYEDRSENRFLKDLWVGRSGEVENTTFAILGPDGKQVLVKPSRSPRHDFEDGRELAATMQRIARPYASKQQQAGPPLPLVANARLALDVAACDRLPLVVLNGSNPRLAAKLESLAWSQDFIGKFLYTRASSPQELAKVAGVDKDAVLLVIAPDRFGKAGNVLQQLDSSNASTAAIVSALNRARALYKPKEETYHAHVFAGQQKGAFWETAIPVTDLMELEARSWKK